jgi:hypothetical protein
MVLRHSSTLSPLVHDVLKDPYSHVEVVADLGLDKVGVSVDGDYHIGQTTAHGSFDGFGGGTGEGTGRRVGGGEQGVDEGDDGGIGKGHEAFEDVVKELGDLTLCRGIMLFHGKPARIKTFPPPPEEGGGSRNRDIYIEGWSCMALQQFSVFCLL